MLRSSSTITRRSQAPVTASTSCSCGPGRSCDGLECLCRPRFFAGQLLTEDDLNRLDHYIVAKNRLHNRYLHGTGVVCGLEVVCNPCDDTVTVRTGYALGPCGEDIVVCHDAPVDVGALIREHRKQRARVDCEPYGARPISDCEAATQGWILAICFDEQPTRGVTSLRPQHSGCGCSCKGCGGTESVDACSCLSPRTTPIQCEPTVTCEGYRFVLRRVPPPTRAGAFASSELGERVQACLMEITAQIQKPPTNPTTAQLVAYCCELKANLGDLIATGIVHDCLLGQRLSVIVCPDPADQQAAAQAAQAIQEMLQIAIELFKSCVCSALLPPCPVDAPDDCVPLATLSVRTADLRVINICNWSSREFAVTLPTLGYWLGWLPIFDTLRQAITRLCCGPTRAPSFQVDPKLKIRPVASAMQATASPVTGLMAQFARSTTPLSGMEATVLAALGAQPARGKTLATDLEIENPLAALALTRLAAPSVGAAVPPEVIKLLGQAFQDSPAPGPDRLDDLATELAAVRKKVDAQARTISTLRKRISDT